eukprot:754698-Pelagomonas_calceolata.AAC.1
MACMAHPSSAGPVQEAVNAGVAVLLILPALTASYKKLQPPRCRLVTFFEYTHLTNILTAMAGKTGSAGRGKGSSGKKAMSRSAKAG